MPPSFLVSRRWLLTVSALLLSSSLILLTSGQVFTPPTPTQSPTTDILPGSATDAQFRDLQAGQPQLDQFFSETFTLSGLYGERHNGDNVTDWDTLAKRLGLTGAALAAAYAVWRRRRLAELDAIKAGDQAAALKFFNTHFDPSGDTYQLRHGGRVRDWEAFAKAKGLAGAGATLMAMYSLWRRKRVEEQKLSGHFVSQLAGSDDKNLLTRIKDRLSQHFTTVRNRLIKPQKPALPAELEQYQRAVKELPRLRGSLNGDIDRQRMAWRMLESQLDVLERAKRDLKPWYGGRHRAHLQRHIDRAQVEADQLQQDYEAKTAVLEAKRSKIRTYAQLLGRDDLREKQAAYDAQLAAYQTQQQSYAQQTQQLAADWKAQEAEALRLAAIHRQRQANRFAGDTEFRALQSQVTRDVTAESERQVKAKKDTFLQNFKAALNLFASDELHGLSRGVKPVTAGASSTLSRQQTAVVTDQRSQFIREVEEDIDYTTPLEELFPPQKTPPKPQASALESAWTKYQAAMQDLEKYRSQAPTAERIQALKAQIKTLDTYVKSADHNLKYSLIKIQKKPWNRWALWSYNQNVLQRNQLANRKKSLEAQLARTEEALAKVTTAQARQKEAARVLEQDFDFFIRKLNDMKSARRKGLIVERNRKNQQASQQYRQAMSHRSYWVRRNAQANYSRRHNAIQQDYSRQASALNDEFAPLIRELRAAATERERQAAQFEANRQAKIKDYARKRRDIPAKKQVMTFLQNIQKAAGTSRYFAQKNNDLRDLSAYLREIDTLQAERTAPSPYQAEIDALQAKLEQPNELSWSEYLDNKPDLKRQMQRDRYGWTIRDQWQRNRHNMQTGDRYWSQQYGKYAADIATHNKILTPHMEAKLRELGHKAYEESMKSYAGWENYYRYHPGQYSAMRTNWQTRLAALQKLEAERQTTLQQQTKALETAYTDTMDKLYEMKTWLAKAPADRAEDTLTTDMIAVEEAALAAPVAMAAVSSPLLKGAGGISDSNYVSTAANTELPLLDRLRTERTAAEASWNAQFAANKTRSTAHGSASATMQAGWQNEVERMIAYAKGNAQRRDEKTKRELAQWEDEKRARAASRASAVAQYRGSSAERHVVYGERRDPVPEKVITASKTVTVGPADTAIGAGAAWRAMDKEKRKATLRERIINLQKIAFDKREEPNKYDISDNKKEALIAQNVDRGRAPTSAAKISDPVRREAVEQQLEEYVNNSQGDSPQVSNFEKYLPRIFDHEGGFVDHPHDAGGATNKGITIGTFELYAKKDLGIEPTLDNLKILTNEQATIIYKKRFWDVVRADEIKSESLAFAMFDFQVNSGSWAIQRLKEALNSMGFNLPVNMIMDDETVKAVNQVDPRKLFDEYKLRRIMHIEGYIEGDPRQESFRNGWGNRLNNIQFND